MMRVVVNAVPVLLAVAWLVGAGVWNRGEVLVRVTLTDREAAWRGGGPDEPVRLWIDWQPRVDPQDARNWLTHDRLRRLGFDLSVPAAAPPAERAYRRTLPRRAWVAFEIDGEAWRAIERRREVTAPAQQDWRSRLDSRLVPVDAAPEARDLVEKYGDGRHLILPAWIELNWVGPGRGGPLVFATIRALDPPSVIVPRSLATRLRALAPAPRVPRVPGEDASAPPAAPRYEVDLAVGRSGIPWVEDVR